MSHYIDGFVFPVLRDRLDDYKKVALSVANIYCEHGAIEYREFVGDDLAREGTRHFPELINSSEEETVVFGWIIFESRESRVLVNQRVEADPRMVELVAPLLDVTNPIFDPSRMAYGGFQPLIHAINENPGK